LTLDHLIQPITGLAYRVVEDQEEIATLALVDSIDEHSLLESILEDSKPSPSIQHKDYLINTPFRYAPLNYGSRFGSRFENSLFYGSLSQQTALAEVAYYRTLFWSHISKPPTEAIKTSHTLFNVKYSTEQGIRLQSCTQWQNKLTHPNDYSFTQQVGSSMREIGVEGFEFVSARDKQKGLNVAFFNPNPIRSKRALNKETLQCITNSTRVSFKQKGTFKTWSYISNEVA